MSIENKWRCYFHEGPCKQLKCIDGVSLERHSNGKYVWWEIYDKKSFRTLTFERRKDAEHHFELLISKKGMEYESR